MRDREKEKEAKLYKVSLRSFTECFIEKAFGTLNPGTKYLDNWHIKEIAEKLLALEDGKIKRLVINMPPRYLKSISVAVSWPAFLLGRNPARRIVVASHNAALSVKHSIDTRKIMRSDWYKELFPAVEFARDQNEKAKFMTADSGFRLATSVGGAVTGEGGNFLIVDDPLSPENALSPKARKSVMRWFDQTFSTRLDDKKNGAIVVVMQRLHEEDLSGSLLARGWDYLCLPVVGADGKLLHEEREGWDEINSIRRDMGEYGFAAQYMQAPYALEGGIIRGEWLKFYDGREMPEGVVYQSWDTAIKVFETSDYSVCLTFMETANGFYVVDCLREKLNYPDLKRKFLALAEKWNPQAILLEDKASGQSLIQDLQRETTWPVIAQMPKDDKLTRLASVSPLIEAGKLFLPRLGNWTQVLQAELVGFPNSGNDDMVDALSQFLNWVRIRERYLPSLRKL